MSGPSTLRLFLFHSSTGIHPSIYPATDSSITISNFPRYASLPQNNIPQRFGHRHHLRYHRANKRLQTPLPRLSDLFSRLLVRQFNPRNSRTPAGPDYTREETAACRVASPRRVYRCYCQSHGAGCSGCCPREKLARATSHLRSGNTAAQAPLATCTLYGRNVGRV